MRQLLSALLLLLSFMVPGLAPPAQAAAIAAEDAQAVQAVVRAQLAAFAADDAERAFSFATPDLRQQFGSASNFIEMVRSSYPVVYRAASVMFLAPEADNEVVLLPVRLTDAQGAAWKAVYKLVRLQDRSWRIAGCVLVPSKDRTV